MAAAIRALLSIEDFMVLNSSSRFCSSSAYLPCSRSMGSATPPVKSSKASASSPPSKAS